MKPLPKEKLNARKRYWGLVTATQQEFCAQVIHQGIKTKDIIETTKLSPATVDRFLSLGIGRKKPKPYSWMHGPYATTLFAIADSLGYEFKAQKKIRVVKFSFVKEGEKIMTRRVKEYVK